MNETNVAAAAAEAVAQPTIVFDSITFSDGTTIEIGAGDVVVLVGPNNSGKSLALRELEDYVGADPESKVITSVELRKNGSSDSFQQFVYDNARVRPTNQSRRVRVDGYRVSFNWTNGELGSIWPDDVSVARALFCLRIPTESRITDSNATDAVDLLTASPSHPIHLLDNDAIEQRLSDYFKRGFGQDLILYRPGSSKWHLLVGERLPLHPGEDRVSTTYRQRLLASTEPLEIQGDGMRSFASVILHLLAPLTPSILLLDEPEAFLHPPQARLLGEIIATEKSSSAQLFLATHSHDVLQGLMGSASERLRVLRIQREGNVNRVQELNKELVRRISGDSLMRYSSVLSGVFHERVIICESEADCMFYGSILDLPEVNGEQHPDVLFVRANGKHQVPSLTQTLVALGVPVDVVVDIDVLNDTDLFQRIIEALGGDWFLFESSARAVKNAVEARRPPLSVNEIAQNIREVVDQTADEGVSQHDLRNNIDAQFRKASAWDPVKTAGESALPAGEATRHFRSLQSHGKNIGLWMVPVGELENFCKSVGGHGPSWVQEVLSRPDFSTDPELEDARKFVQDIWS